MATQSSPTEFYYPNRMGRILLLSMEEILGQAALTTLLDRAGAADRIENYPPLTQALEFPFRTVARLQAALEELYGPRGGRGLALRVGRASFLGGLREFGPHLGLTDAAFRLLPLPAKIKIGAGAFAELFNKFSDQRVRLEENSTQITWHIERCPVCWERHTEEPACHLAVGLLQESLYWVSGGKLFHVEEIACHARGDSDCSILIDKTPLG
ncbi:MAG: 4-vinyl reductase [Anaerolineales bacterium]